jgi:SAM-dependent methyltransferase
VKLADLIARRLAPLPWSEGEKIPWHDPAFSRRMLDEHLSQAHDAASRRTPIIAAQVAWIHDSLLGGQRTRILDLGCGPGLYASRLAARGHAVVGIDFSPASIEYARAQREACPDDLVFTLGDVRTAELPGPFGLAMLLFGEGNAFRRGDLERLLVRTNDALEDGGTLLLEFHPEDAVRRIGARPATWHTARRGLFGDDPYLCLRESFWDEEHFAAIERWYVVDLATGETTRHAASLQAYPNEGYRELLARCGFAEPTILSGMGEAFQEDLRVLVARKPASETP